VRCVEGLCSVRIPTKEELRNLKIVLDGLANELLGRVSQLEGKLGEKLDELENSVVEVVGDEDVERAINEVELLEHQVEKVRDKWRKVFHARDALNYALKELENVYDILREELGVYM